MLYKVMENVQFSPTLKLVAGSTLDTTRISQKDKESVESEVASGRKILVPVKTIDTEESRKAALHAESLAQEMMSEADEAIRVAAAEKSHAEKAIAQAAAEIAAAKQAAEVAKQEAAKAVAEAAAAKEEAERAIAQAAAEKAQAEKVITENAETAGAAAQPVEEPIRRAPRPVPRKM